MRRILFAFGVFFGGCGQQPAFMTPSAVAVTARLDFDGSGGDRQVPEVRSPTEPLEVYRRPDGCVGLYDPRGPIDSLAVSLVDPPVGFWIYAGTEDQFGVLCLHPADATVEVLARMTVEE